MNIAQSTWCIFDFADLKSIEDLQALFGIAAVGLCGLLILSLIIQSLRGGK